MRRVLRKGIAVALAAAMVVTLAPASADAAKKPSVSKKASVKVGKTTKIKVKNGSKKAKVTWKTSNKKVAKITKKTTKGNKATATVKGVKAGKAKITASYKLGKKKAKKLVCTVTVSGTTTPTVTPTPVVPGGPTPVPTGNDNPVPTEQVTPTPVPTEQVTPTPAPKAKNKNLDARQASAGVSFTIDGKVESGEGWEDADANDLLTDITKTFGVRKSGTADVEAAAKEIPVTEAKASIMYSGKDLYVLLDVKGDSDKVIIYYDENKKASNDTATTIEIPVGDGDAKSSKADYTVEAKTVKADGGYVVEAKITGKADLAVDDNVNIDIQMNKGDVSVNFYDTRSAMVYNEESKEFELGDVDVKVGENAELMGPVTLLAQKPAATSALWTEFGAQILEASGIADAPFEKTGEGEDVVDTNTKAVKYVDAKYWTDTYADHGADSIEFAQVNIPSWRGDAAHVGLADLVEGTEEEFTTNRNYAQAYVMWDDEYLYVMFDVNDKDISPGNEDHYTTDSTELFLDEDALCDTYDAEKDAVQLRIDAATNVFSSSNDAGAGNYAVVGHAVGYKHADGTVDDKIEGATGYQTQYIIKLHSKHTPNSVMGVELQINDCFTSDVDPDGNAWADEEGNTTDADGNPIKGACRAATLTAYDTTNTAYENPELFERLKLIKKGVTEVPNDPTTTPPATTDTPSTPSTPGMNEENTIYTVDLTKTSVAGWGVPATVAQQDDGSVKLSWAADADNYTGVTFSFDAQDFTDWSCVIDATGDSRTLLVQDATRTEPSWGNPYDVLAPKYGQAFPCKVKLNAAALNTALDKDGNAADFKNVGKVVFGKGTEKEAKSLTVKSIVFYKNESDIPK